MTHRYRLHNDIYPTLEVVEAWVPATDVFALLLDPPIGPSPYPTIRIDKEGVHVSQRIPNDPVNWKCVSKSIPSKSYFKPGDLSKLIENLLFKYPEEVYKAPDNKLGVKVLSIRHNTLHIFFETGYRLFINPGPEHTIITLISLDVNEPDRSIHLGHVWSIDTGDFA